MKELPNDWTPAQNELFQRVYSFMVKNPLAFVHPQTPLIAPEFWETTCFNSAYSAAEFAGGCGTFTIFSDDDTVFASERDGSLQ